MSCEWQLSKFIFLSVKPRSQKSIQDHIQEVILELIKNWDRKIQQINTILFLIN